MRQRGCYLFLVEGQSEEHDLKGNNFHILVDLLIVTAVSSGLVSCALEATTPKIQATATRPPLAKPSGKLSARLDMLANTPALHAASIDEQARALSLPVRGPGSLVRDAQGRVLVNIRATDLSAKGLQSLRDAGAVIMNVSERYQQVTAFVAMSDLAAVANLSTVMNAQEELAPENSGGAVIPNPP